MHHDSKRRTAVMLVVVVVVVAIDAYVDSRTVPWNQRVKYSHHPRSLSLAETAAAAEDDRLHANTQFQSLQHRMIHRNDDVDYEIHKAQTWLVEDQKFGLYSPRHVVLVPYA
jgi:Tfp pilus assembly protein PilE